MRSIWEKKSRKHVLIVYITILSFSAKKALAAEMLSATRIVTIARPLLLLRSGGLGSKRFATEGGAAGPEGTDFSGPNRTVEKKLGISTVNSRG